MLNYSTLLPNWKQIDFFDRLQLSAAVAITSFLSIAYWDGNKLYFEDTYFIGTIALVVSNSIWIILGKKQIGLGWLLQLISGSLCFINLWFLYITCFGLSFTGSSVAIIYPTFLLNLLWFLLSGRQLLKISPPM